jgi:cell division protein FtsL
MAGWTSTAQVEAPSVPRPWPRSRPRRASAAPRRRLAGGVVWIGVLAVLLVGVVAVNVAVLRLNMQIEKLGQQRLELEAQNALLESRVSSTLAPARIEREARTKLGLLPATESTYVELRSRR